jgi:membrane-associated protease RseP (regulator of RpoE activity)
MFLSFVAALTLATPDLEAGAHRRGAGATFPQPGRLRHFSDAGAVPVSLPSKERSTILPGGLPRAGSATPAPVKKRMFGIGVGFQARGTTQGIVLDQIVDGSPAGRAGLTPGTVIAEINGESTLGRTGEECTRMVREGGNAVTIKYYDPATLKLRTRTLEKDWFPLPN